jgi:hypothetical protein
MTTPIFHFTRNNLINVLSIPHVLANWRGDLRKILSDNLAIYAYMQPYTVDYEKGVFFSFTPSQLYLMMTDDAMVAKQLDFLRGKIGLDDTEPQLPKEIWQMRHDSTGKDMYFVTFDALWKEAGMVLEHRDRWNCDNAGLNKKEDVQAILPGKQFRFCSNWTVKRILLA